MSSKHTTGPWSALYDTGTTDKLGQNHSGCTFGERFIVAEGIRAGSRCIADCGYGRSGRSDAETIANARLIAAAPTMFDYLTLLALRGDNEAHEIIKKITGS